MAMSSSKNMILAVELIGFSMVLLFLWLDELLDLPHVLFGGPATPINWTECLFESVMLIFLGTYVVTASYFVVGSLGGVSGGPPVCPACNRMKINDSWYSFRDYVARCCEEDGQHGLCPQCSMQSNGNRSETPS